MAALASPQSVADTSCCSPGLDDTADLSLVGYHAEVVRAHSGADPEDLQLHIKVGDIVIVLEEHPSGWMGGCKVDDHGNRGWFPAACVRALRDHSESFHKQILSASMVDAKGVEASPQIDKSVLETSWDSPKRARRSITTPQTGREGEGVSVSLFHSARSGLPGKQSLSSAEVVALQGELMALQARHGRTEEQVSVLQEKLAKALAERGEALEQCKLQEAQGARCVKLDQEVRALRGELAASRKAGEQAEGRHREEERKLQALLASSQESRRGEAQACRDVEQLVASLREQLAQQANACERTKQQLWEQEERRRRAEEEARVLREEVARLSRSREEAPRSEAPVVPRTAPQLRPSLFPEAPVLAPPEAAAPIAPVSLFPTAPAAAASPPPAIVVQPVDVGYQQGPAGAPAPQGGRGREPPRFAASTEWGLRARESAAWAPVTPTAAYRQLSQAQAPAPSTPQHPSGSPEQCTPRPGMVREAIRDFEDRCSSSQRTTAVALAQSTRRRAASRETSWTCRTGTGTPQRGASAERAGPRTSPSLPPPWADVWAGRQPGSG